MSVISVKDVSKTYWVREKQITTIKGFFSDFSSLSKKRKIRALKSIDFQVKSGEFFGIIGSNGSGKSTLLKILLGVIPPDSGGKVKIKGKAIRLSLGMGFDPNLSARENIYINASMLGLSFKEIGDKFSDIVDFAELEDYQETKLKFYSRGMKSRLAFAIATNAKADIFLMDEFFGGVGDLNFREKSESIFKNRFVDNRTIIHVGHNLKHVIDNCDRVLLLHKGEQIALGEPREVVKKYKEILKESINE